MGSTARSAPAQVARPAPEPEHLTDLGGDPARLLCHLRPAVPERDNAHACAGVVPARIAPAGLSGMGGLAVELNHYRELPVVVVQVARPTACSADGLSFRS